MGNTNTYSSYENDGEEENEQLIDEDDTFDNTGEKIDDNVLSAELSSSARKNADEEAEAVAEAEEKEEEEEPERMEEILKRPKEEFSSLPPVIDKDDTFDNTREEIDDNDASAELSCLASKNPDEEEEEFQDMEKPLDISTSPVPAKSPTGKPKEIFDDFQVNSYGNETHGDQNASQSGGGSTRGRSKGGPRGSARDGFVQGQGDHQAFRDSDMGMPFPLMSQEWGFGDDNTFLPQTGHGRQGGQVPQLIPNPKPKIRSRGCKEGGINVQKQGEYQTPGEFHEGDRFSFGDDQFQYTQRQRYVEQEGGQQNEGRRKNHRWNEDLVFLSSLASGVVAASRTCDDSDLCSFGGVAPDRHGQGRGMRHAQSMYSVVGCDRSVDTGESAKGQFQFERNRLHACGLSEKEIEDTFKGEEVVLKLRNSDALLMVNDIAKSKDSDVPDESGGLGASVSGTVKAQVSQQSQPTTQQLHIVVDPDVMEFVTTTALRVQLSNSLAAKKSEITWKPSNKTAVIVYRGKDDSDSWQSECIDEVQNFLSKFAKCDVQVNKDFWEAVVAQLSSVCACLGIDPPLVKTIDDSFVARIVSLSTDVKGYEEKLKAKLEEIYREETRKTFLKKTVSDVPEERLILLKRIKFVKQLQEKNKELEIKLDTEGKEIHFEGPQLQFTEATMKFEKQMSNMVEKKLTLSDSILDVLGSDKGLQKVKRELENNNVEAVVVIDKDARIIGTSAEHADNAARHVNKLMLEQKVKVDEKSEYLLKTSEWCQVCEMVNKEGDVRVHRNNLNDTYVAGFRDDVTEMINILNEILEANCIREEQFRCPSQIVRTYIAEHRQEDLRTIENKLKDFEVTIRNGKGDDDFDISGHQNGLTLVRQELDALIKDIDSQTFFVKQPGLRTYFDSGEGDRLVKSVEKDKRCLIQVQKYFGQRRIDLSTHGAAENDGFNGNRGDEATVGVADGSALNMTQGQKISWRTGNIEKEKAVAIVSSCGACSQPVVSASGPAMKRGLVAPNAGEITVSGGYGLACSHVIHTTCCKGNGGKGERTIRDIVHNCLQKGEERGARSITFPVISIGNLKFSHCKASRIMLEETVSFCQANPGSTVQDIRFVVSQQDHAFTAAFKQEMNRLQAKHKSGRVGLALRTFRSTFRRRVAGSTGRVSIAVRQVDLFQETTYAILFQEDHALTAVREMDKLQAKQKSRLEGTVGHLGSKCKQRAAESKEHVNIEVLQGDLCQEKTDAIVNIISQDMNMERAGALSKAVKQASGPKVQAECSRLGRQSGGTAVITSGGKLSARHIIHLIPNSALKDHLQQCVERCLRLAETHRLQSISIPAVGTGAFGLSAVDSASLIFKALGNASFNTVRKVRIVVFQPPMLKAFQQQHRRYSHPNDGMTSPICKDRRLSVEVINGDLTEEKTNAIINVNSTDMNMNNAGELSKALAKACGQQVQQECSQLGKQPQGSAVMTSGGKLNAPHIIHIVPRSSDKMDLQKCLEEGLRLADKNKLQSISIPAIGTGGRQLLATDSANLVFKALRNVIGNFQNITKVRIVVFQGRMIEAFQQQKNLLDTQYVLHGSSSPEPSQPSVSALVTGNNKDSVVKAVNDGLHGSSSLALATDQSFQPSVRVAGKNKDSVDNAVNDGLHGSLSPGSATDQYFQPSVSVSVTGKNKDSVEKAVNELKTTLSEACITKKIDDEDIASFSPTQINNLQQEAYKCDTEVKFDQTAKCVTVCGYHGNVRDMALKIKDEISIVIKEKSQKQEDDDAGLISKMVEWSYESSGGKIALDLKTNAKLERAYQSEKVSIEQVTLNGEEFIVDMQTLKGRFHTGGEQINLYRKAKEEPLPSNWSPMLHGTKVLPVKLDPVSPEYQDVKAKFHATLDGVNILKIERIQNPLLYQSYMLIKRKMGEDTGGDNEKQLFHGTEAKNINRINTQGFNRSFWGSAHGARFGNGVYFANKASYSASYTGSGGGACCMYLARVLVGRYCQGAKQLITPPSRDPARPELLFDSVVDNPTDPTIFVVFSDYQCYPEYLISFKKNVLS